MRKYMCIMVRKKSWMVMMQTVSSDSLSAMTSLLVIWRIRMYEHPSCTRMTPEMNPQYASTLNF